MRFANRTQELRDVARVVDVLALRGLAPDRHGMLCCPLVGHDDKTPSFHVLSSGSGYICFGCQRRGDAIRLVLELGIAHDFVGALDVLAQRYGKDRDDFSVRRPDSDRTRAPLPDATPSSDDLAKLKTYLAGVVDILGSPGARYVASRGIAPDVAAKHGLRFHPSWQPYANADASWYRPAVTAELFDANGTRVGAQGRYIGRTRGPKTMTAGKLHGLYSTLGASVAAVVAVCESPLDAVSIATVGVEAVALCGVGSDMQRTMLRRCLAGRRAIIATDSDDAGNAAADTLRATLTSSRCVRLRFDDAKDANEMLQRDRDDFAAMVAATLEALR